MSTKKTDDWVSAVIIDDDDESDEVYTLTKRKPVVSEEVVQDVVQDVVQKKKRNILTIRNKYKHNTLI